MRSNDTLTIALLAALVVVLAYYSGCGGKREHFEADPYAALHQQLDAVRGSPDAAHQLGGAGNPNATALPPGSAIRASGPSFSARDYSMTGAGASATPEQVAEAEREQWFSATEDENTGHFNTELAQDATADTLQYHSAAPAIDYDGYITDLVADPRTKENHRRWVAEMRPWSGAAMKVDDLDPENFLHFQGLRRPQAVVQHNPLQLTEVDTRHLAKNKKFNFQG